jgi:hypothetical protein
MPRVGRHFPSSSSAVFLGRYLNKYPNILGRAREIGMATIQNYISSFGMFLVLPFIIFFIFIFFRGGGGMEKLEIKIGRQLNRPKP